MRKVLWPLLMVLVMIASTAHAVEHKNPPLRPFYEKPKGCQILKIDSEGNVTKYKDCHLYRHGHTGDWFLKDNDRKEYRYKP